MEGLATWIKDYCPTCTAESIALQIGIFIFGCTAIWFVGRLESWRRWGYIFGLCAQPFWFIMLYRDQKYIVLATSCLYAYSWMQGVWFHWLQGQSTNGSNVSRIRARARERGIREKDLWEEMAREYFDNHPEVQKVTVSEQFPTATKPALP